MAVSVHSSTLSQILPLVFLLVVVDSRPESLDAQRFSIPILSGTVFCDSCLEARLTDQSIVFAGAEIQIQCSPVFSATVVSNDTGQFVAELPPLPAATVCSVRLSSAPVESCSIATRTTTTMTISRDRGSGDLVIDLAFRPQRAFAFCAASSRRETLTLGPPDPQSPSSTKSKNTESYSLGPPEPPRPRKFVVTKSYRLGPPNPPQPRGVHN